LAACWPESPRPDEAMDPQSTANACDGRPLCIATNVRLRRRLAHSLRDALRSESPSALHCFRVPGISPILTLVARPDASRTKSTVRPLVLKKDVALAGRSSYLG